MATPGSTSSEGDGRTANNGARHQYRKLSEAEKTQMVHVKDLGQELLELVDHLGQGREFSISKTKIEEAVMWAVKGITK